MQRVLYKDGVQLPDQDVTQGFDEVRYVIPGKDALTLKEMTWGQHKVVKARLLEDVKKSLTENRIEGNDLLIEPDEEKQQFVLCTALGVGSETINNLPAGVVNQMMQDFFFLNPELRKALATIAASMVLSSTMNTFKDLNNTVETILRPQSQNEDQN